MKSKYLNLNYDEIFNLSPTELKKLQKKRGWLLYAIGTIVYKVLTLLGNKPADFYGICPYFEIGSEWGGLEMGWFFICCKDATYRLKCHEVGHGLQNANIGGIKMGILCLFSAIRYWNRELFKSNTQYDDWWFEGQATQIGMKYTELHKERKD